MHIFFVTSKVYICMYVCCNVPISHIFLACVFRYKMMSKCWSFNPSERPTFSELVHQTKEMITVLEQQMKQGQHTTDIDSTYVNTETCTDYHYHDNNHAEEEEEAIALA